MVIKYRHIILSCRINILKYRFKKEKKGFLMTVQFMSEWTNNKYKQKRP